MSVLLHPRLLGVSYYAICFLEFKIIDFTLLLWLIINFVDILLGYFFHSPDFVLKLELKVLKLHLLERGISHNCHVDNYIESSDTDHRPANIVLKFWVIYKLSEHKKVIGRSNNA